MVKCLCDCGKESVVRATFLRCGHTKSCGCALLRNAALALTKHGCCVGGASDVYSIWNMMKQRCGNPNCRSYKDYGYRGINVCERWMKFENFRDDMGPRPAGFSIERINNDGNYEPSNCRWASRAQQASNKRNTVRLTLNGEKTTVSELANMTGVSRDNVRHRIVKKRETPQDVLDCKKTFSMLGEGKPNSKLTWALVDRMREEYYSPNRRRGILVRYSKSSGVSTSAIYDAIVGKSWAKRCKDSSKELQEN